MLAFTLTLDQALLFFEICSELKADNEEKRVEILKAMAELGKVKNIVETPKTKDEYIKYLATHFGTVLNIKGESNG